MCGCSITLWSVTAAASHWLPAACSEARRPPARLVSGAPDWYNNAPFATDRPLAGRFTEFD